MSKRGFPILFQISEHLIHSPSLLTSAYLTLPILFEFDILYTSGWVFVEKQLPGIFAANY
jgi:hypothetical protein